MAVINALHHHRRLITDAGHRPHSLGQHHVGVKLLDKTHLLRRPHTGLAVHIAAGAGGEHRRRNIRQHRTGVQTGIQPLGHLHRDADAQTHIVSYGAHRFLARRLNLPPQGGKGGDGAGDVLKHRKIDEAAVDVLCALRVAPAVLFKPNLGVVGVIGNLHVVD